MITVRKQITINPGIGETGPYSYIWQATSSNSNCVEFSPSSSGIITNPSAQQITTDLIFFNESCIEETTITLSISYNNGECVKTFTVPITNPCTDFDVRVSVNTQNGFVFSAVPLNGTGPFKYYWDWDEAFFAPVGPITTATSILKLGYIGASNSAPETSTVYVNVVDANGCSVAQAVDFNSCALTFDPMYVTLQCQPDGTSAATVCIVSKGCARSLVDWASFSYNIPGFTIELLPLGTPNQPFQTLACLNQGGRRFRITATTAAPNFTYATLVNFPTTTGISAYLPLTLIVPECEVGGNQVSIAAQSPFQITCDYMIGDTFLIGPISDFINNTGNSPVDYSSFRFIDLTTGIPTAGPLTTPLLGSVSFNPSTLNIEYTVPAMTGTDSFKWTICNEAGSCAESQTYAIVLDCTLVPTAVADSECAVCGETQDIDVLANDTINGVLYDLAVTTAPTNGSAVFNGDYSTPRIVYTPNATYSGSDTFEYTVTNDSGESDTATVTLNVLCAGQDSNISVCQ